MFLLHLFMRAQCCSAISVWFPSFFCFNIFSNYSPFWKICHCFMYILHVQTMNCRINSYIYEKVEKENQKLKAKEMFFCICLVYESTLLSMVWNRSGCSGKLFELNVSICFYFFYCFSLRKEKKVISKFIPKLSFDCQISPWTLKKL